MQQEILDEIKRQYEETIDRANSTDTKVAIILGFIFTTIGLLLDKDFLSLVFKGSYYNIAFFALGLILIIYAVYCGIYAVFFRLFSLGPNVADLLKSYAIDPDQDFKLIISGKLLESNQNNKSVIDDKINYGKKTFSYFLSVC
jgi:hypothetical protein